MAKPKYITVENYREFLPSEFVRSFTSDVDVAIEAKLPMDMSSFVKRDYSKCLPCLGGLACMNFGLKPDKHGTHTQRIGDIGDFTENIGDAIRLGRGPVVRRQLEKLYKVRIPNELPTLDAFLGVTGTKELRALKKQIIQYADAITAMGY